MNHYYHAIFLIIIVTSIPTRDSCTNYYDKSNPPATFCQDQECYFSEGLEYIVDDISTEKEFILCLILPSYNVTVYNQTTDQPYAEELPGVYIQASSLQISAGYSMLNTKSCVLLASTVSIVGATLAAPLLYIQSASSLTIQESQFVNDASINTKCSCVAQSEPCVSWSFKYPYLYFHDRFNFSAMNDYTYEDVVPETVTLIAPQMSVVNCTFKYSVIGMLGEGIKVRESVISTNGLGYMSDEGEGCGYFDEVLNQLLGCMGSGGSHGGFGGNSSPKNCYLLISKPPYGSIDFPYSPGSGGGFYLRNSRDSSSGGGVINIQSSNLTLLNSTVTSDGKNGFQGGGGGAGGSISIDYNYINTNSVISANGGNGDKSSSGAGGRIRLWNHQWQNQSIEEQKNGLVLTVIGGENCPQKYSCGQNGSIYTSPCRPGLYLAYQCQLGTYQISFGYSFCLPCANKPQNSQYSDFKGEYYYENACNYTCLDNYTMRNGKCLSSFQRIVDNIGGPNVLMCMGIVTFLVVTFIIVMIVRKFLEKEAFTFEEKELDPALKRQHFKLEDLPFHEHRLYFSGDNSPFQPWTLPEQTINNFKNQIKNPITKVIEILEPSFSQISKACQFTKFEKILLFILKYSYYALSRVVLSYFRTKKVQNIYHLVVALNNKVCSLQSIQVKFHVKQNMTVGSLQFFNKSKSVYDFYIENYFPLYLMLQRVPLGKGYIIDFTDPFLRVFINQTAEKEEQNSKQKGIEKFMKVVSQLIKSSNETLSLLNHLWSIDKISSTLQIYLWQSPNILLGLDKFFQIDDEKPLFLIITVNSTNSKHFLFQENLPSVYLHEIQRMKHKFNIRKESINSEPKLRKWGIKNNYSEKCLLWSLGVLTVLNLILCFFGLFLMIFILMENSAANFLYAIIIYFVFETFSEFGAAFYTFGVIRSKSEQTLAGAVYFTITSIIKMGVLFICIVINNTLIQSQGQLFQFTLYVWLFMVIIEILMLIFLLMLRMRIHAQT